MSDQIARMRFAGTLLAALALVPLVGLADQAPTGQSSGGSASAPKAGIILEEITVTAQKRVELLEKVPIAITAVTGDTLKESGTVDAQGLNDLVPGLQVSYNNANTTFAIRGISSGTDATLGDSAVAFHIDGVYQGRPAAASSLFYDLSRVEVLRGPQGTLYGRNATAGAINLVTNRPSFDGFAGSGEIETGDYSLLRTSGMFNAPVSDTLAVRGAFQTQRHSGYLNTGYGDADDVAGRLQALYRPSETFSLLLGGDYFHQGGIGRGVVSLPYQSDPWTTANPQITATGYASPPGWTNNESWQAHAELNWRIGDVVLTDVAAYHHLHVNYFAYFNQIDSIQDDIDKETSNELRLSSAPESKINWVLGAYYHDESQPYWQQFYDNTGPAPDGCCQYLGQGTSLKFIYTTIDNPSYAGFGQLTVPVADAFRVTAGVRYNHDHKRVIGGTYRYYGSDTQTFAGLVPAGTLELRIPTDADTSWTHTDWKVGAEWDVGANSLAYANISTGYKQGGVFAGAPPNNTYNPETLTSYEIGMKNWLLNRTVELNVDAFYYKYKDYQVDQLEQLAVPGGGKAYGDDIFNAARSTQYGIELESAWIVTESDRIDLTAAYLHAVFDEFQFPLQAPPPRGPGAPAPVVFQDLSGYPPAHAPEWTGTIAYRHEWTLSNSAHLTAMLQSHFESEQWLTVDQEPGSRQAGFSRSLVSLTYETPPKSFWASVYCRNIENKAVANSFSWSGDPTAAPYVSIGPPRTYGIVVGTKF